VYGDYLCDLRNGRCVQYPQYLRACGGTSFVVAVARKHVQLFRVAHERMSVVDIDVAYGFHPLKQVEVDGLHERAGAYVVQKGVLLVRAEERRVCETVCVRPLGEGQFCPWSEMPPWSVSTVHRRRNCRHTSLGFVRWRVRGYHIAIVVAVADEAPDFFIIVEAVKDEISVFVLAVGSGTNVKLERESPLSR
jgi:hypothetical protein